MSKTSKFQTKMTAREFANQCEPRGWNKGAGPYPTNMTEVYEHVAVKLGVDILRGIYENDNGYNNEYVYVGNILHFSGLDDEVILEWELPGQLVPKVKSEQDMIDMKAQIQEIWDELEDIRSWRRDVDDTLNL